MENNDKLSLEIEAKKKKLEELKTYMNNINQKEKLDSEEKKIIDTLHQKEVVKKYPRLFKFSRAYSNFWKSLFNGLGRGIKRASAAIEKSDKYIAEQTIKENEHKIAQLKLEQQKLNSKKSYLEEAGDID